MEKVKKHRFYHNWTFGGVLISVLLIILVGALIANQILVDKDSIKKNREFTSADWDYMINYIEKEYGNGKKFIILKKEQDGLTKKGKKLCWDSVTDNYHPCSYDIYIGEKAIIIGNFEGEEKAYYVRFERKTGDDKIVATYDNDEHNIDEYK